MPTPSPTPQTPAQAQTPATLMALLEQVRVRAEQAGVYAGCVVHGGMLVCKAKDAGDDAEYRLSMDGGQLWVSLVTPGRYLSQSIEQDLVHAGDKAGDLLRDELIDLGAVASRAEAMPVVEHFRSPERLYTFRTPIGITPADAGLPPSIRKAGDYLLAYAQTFGHLGDMGGGQ